MSNIKLLTGSERLVFQGEYMSNIRQLTGGEGLVLQGDD